VRPETGTERFRHEKAQEMGGRSKVARRLWAALSPRLGYLRDYAVRGMAAAARIVETRCDDGRVMPGKNELGMKGRIATLGKVRVFVASGFWISVCCLGVVAAERAGAVDDSASYSARPMLGAVVLGGQSLTVLTDPHGEANGETAYRELSVPVRQFPLEINVLTAPGARAPVVRLRTRLEGLQDEWQDHESQMWLVLRFLDADNRAVSSAAFIREGESPGWGGLPQNSRWHRRVDEAVVPERSVRVQILLVSGGTPRTSGFWAVRRLQLTAPAAGEAGPGARLFQLEGLSGAGLSSPQGNPDGWLRDGTGLGTPRIFPHTEEGGTVEPVLALIDVDPANTGGWLQMPRAAAPVVPGQRLRFECEEMHSIGRGGDAAASFHALPVGNYVFRAWATDELGRPTGPSLRLPLEVRPPFYATVWFRLLGVGAIGAGLLAGTRYLAWRKMQRELQRLEQRRAIEEERTRLARDIHDEMGARFTQISLLAGRALKAAPADESVREPIRSINGAVKELAAALEEVVWAANPAHDSLEALSNYLSQYAGAVLRDAGVSCRLDIPALLPARPLASGVRHRVMMAVKEALNNTLKHARATAVRVALDFDGQGVRVTVADNGIGFDPATVKRGNGMDHSVRRMEEIGGTCVVDARPGGGATVRLSVPWSTKEEPA
jgi:signal transduction histidine kinase